MKAFWFTFFIFLSINVLAQTDGLLIDYVGTVRDNSAVLDVRSSNQGVMVPRLTLAQRNAISSPAKSLLIFQTDNEPGFYYNAGTPGSPQWERLYDDVGSNISGSGSATQVAFWNSSSSLTSDSELYWDDGNNRLGIGTNTPARNLHVENGGQISLLQGTSVADNSTAGIYWHTGTDYGIYRTSGTWVAPNYQQLMLKWGTGVIIDPGTVYGKSYLDVQGNGIRVTGSSGSVGIGLTDPTRPLSFANTVGEKLSLYSQSATARDYYGFAIESNTLANQVPTGQRHVWYEGSSERMRLVSGNLGIGTTGPVQSLDVNGGIRSTGYYYQNNASPSLVLQDTDHRSGVIHVNSNRMYFLSGSGINGTSWTLNGSYWPLYLNMNTDEAVFGGPAYFMEGNVGVGTTSPSYNLQVVGNTHTSGDFYGHIAVEDTRSVNDAPNVFDREVAFDFKTRSTVGVPGSGTYSGMMTIAPWSDNSGDASHQLNFNEGGIYWRQGQPDASSWDGWQKVVTQPAGSPVPGTCYTRWGEWGCASGLEEVVRGRTGNQEGYNSGGGYAAANVECVSIDATAQSTWSGYYVRLMRADAEGDGMQHVDSKCSICCSGGCYTALGVNTCASGYTAAYTGRTGAIEAYTSESGFRNKTLCIDGTANVRYTWGSGYATRLMRHRDNWTDAQGMQRVPTVCAVCCKY